MLFRSDPFGGSLRFHLGLVSPNSPDCYIYVDDQKYFWKEGEGVMFDETFIHYAENKTDHQRIVLFCDVERPLTNRVVRAINHWVSHHIIKASATQNVEGEKVGFLNHVFGYVYQVRLLGKRIKAWNRRVYYALKWALIGGLLYWIFV